MKVLVTGCAGFIGSHLCERLVADGHEVYGIDDRSAGDVGNLANVRTKMNLGTGAVTEVLPIWTHRYKFDVVFHMAARVGVGQIVRDPLRMIEEHTADMLAIGSAAEKWGAVLVLISSSEVYGARTTTPFSEDDNIVLGPPHLSRWGYAGTKYLTEHYGLALYHQRNVRTVVPRLFNCTGQRQRALDGFVLPIFAQRALSGEPIQIHGTGQSRRCFTHVKDTVEALIRLSDTKAAYGEVVNVGCGYVRTVADVAADVAQYCASRYGVEVAIEHVDPASLDRNAAWSEMPVREPDVTKLAKLTGLRIPDRWAEIVADVCDWQAAQLGVRPRPEAA